MRRQALKSSILWGGSRASQEKSRERAKALYQFVERRSDAVILRSPALRNDEGSLYYVCPRGADSHSLAMVQRERVFPHECGGTHAPLRVSYRQGKRLWKRYREGREKPRTSHSRGPRYACFLRGA
jgi:hypothetical protein